MSRVEFYRHALTEDDIAAAADALRSVFLTTGPRAALFEEAFATYLGVGHAAALSSCTSALFLCLKALNIGPGDEVITTPMTFIATSNAILHAGATPVFVDVEPDTGNIDARQVERAVTSRTRAVIPVHLYGLMADVQDLNDICQRQKLMMIEDAAHATEAVRDGFRPGQLGQAACFSFYATKNLTCGEGGAIATNDPGLAESVRRLRSHGMSKEAAGRYTSRYQHWDMLSLGYKANLSDIQAALLVGQLPRLEAQLKRREAIASRYESAFSELPGVGFPVVRENATSARHLFTIWVEPGRRDEYLWKLQEKGIGVAVNYRAVHLLSYYRSEFGFQEGDFPYAEAIGDRTLTLPLYPMMTDDQVEQVIAAVRDVAVASGVDRAASVSV
jgi:UDP-4-amino-4-deoxy-L-arabinose-oxoglutarate aminotransferase